MKRLFILLITVFQVAAIIAQTGWRTGEMEIRVYYKDVATIHQIDELNLNGDFYPDHAILYVIPKELDRIEELGLPYSILKKDLNAYYKDFWSRNRDAYHSYQEIVDLADSLATHFPSICKKILYGTSLEGRELGALKISDNVETDEPEAEVMFDGGIHGDEIGGPENVIRFARQLCTEYGSDPDITFLIDNREIWLYYMVNPDGRENMSRYNANGVDCNRDWGFMWDEEGYSSMPFGEVETRALRTCVFENQFVVHTTYHSGTEYISCPWSYRYEAPPDADHILHLAGIYSSESGYANLEYGQGSSGMYVINGATKDGNYGTMGSVSWSMEISMSKQPPASQIMMYYNYNLPSMLAMIEYAGYGIEGIVTNAITGDPVQAIIFVDDLYPVYTDSTAGDYHKYILPGTYNVKVIASGYETQEVSDIVIQELSSTIVNFQLVPLDTPRQYAYNIPVCVIPGNNYDDEGNIPAIFGEPDNIYYSLGRNGHVIIDMQKPLQDKPGNDIKVFEGDISQEGYDFFAGQTLDGPWTLLGTGEGTTEFDFFPASVAQARYFKIVDDGNGATTGNDAGFDLDAVSDLDHVWGVFIVMFSAEVDDSGGNSNGRIDPEETVDLLITIGNTGNVNANNVSATLSTTSQYITINQGTASYGTLQQGQSTTQPFNVTADASTPAGTVAEFTLSVVANSGMYSTSFDMEFVIGQLPVLVADLDQNHNSGPVMASIIQGLGIPVDLLTSIPSDPGLYKCIFISLGTYSNNHELTVSEGQALANYLNNNGRLYMEGGDTWSYDDQTAVHPMFGINGIHDGYNDLGLILGQDGSFADDMVFSYTGDNFYIDRLEIASGANDAFQLFRNQVPTYCNSIANDPGGYKTVGSSFEFGGLQDGQSTKEELMIEILEFFGGILTGTEEYNKQEYLSSIITYPNPFQGNATISFFLKEKTQVTTEIFNLNGQLMEVICNQMMDAGYHRINWHAGTGTGEGVYFYRITAGSSVENGKIICIH
ncbi:MAG: T9SS type A sorting domain-containing protein [Bacteroidetes bacterium]|nr:T9SS type A sorting domain-containing protein [Bacteroidota bacterium]